MPQKTPIKLSINNAPTRIRKTPSINREMNDVVSFVQNHHLMSLALTGISDTNLSPSVLQGLATKTVSILKQYFQYNTFQCVSGAELKQNIQKFVMTGPILILISTAKKP